jgi:hypothetical protein
MGPIQQLFALLQQAQAEQGMQKPHAGMLERESVWAPRRGQQGSIPMRDPRQEGPSPPMGGPLTAMYQGDR